MIKIKDYAAAHGVTYEAIRRQIARYADREIDGFRLSEHISKVGRAQYLDEEAEAFLDARRAQNPVVVQQEQRDETIERLRAEVDLLQKRLIKAQDEYRSLLQEKHQIEMREQALIADKQKIEELKEAREAAEKKAEQAELEKEQLAEREKAAEEARKAAEAEKEEARAAIEAAQEEAARLRSWAEEVSVTATKAQERADRMENAGLLARIFRNW